MKTALTYGFGMALAGALLTLLLYFTGFHDSPEKLSSGQWLGTLGAIAIGITGTTLAMREKRANFPIEDDWGYGNALGAGVLTGLFAGLFSAVFTYVYFAIINPGMSELILQSQIAAMEAKGMPAANIERAEPMMRKWMSPPVITVMQLFFGFLWNVIISLVIAIFLRRRPTAAELPPSLAT